MTFYGWCRDELREMIADIQNLDAHISRLQAGEDDPTLEPVP